MRYIGSKKDLVMEIYEEIKKRSIPKGIFIDIFSGTAVVGNYFKKKGYKIISNDILHLSYSLQMSYIKINKFPIFKYFRNKFNLGNENNFFIENSLKNCLENYFNNIEPVKDFFYKNYSPNNNYSNRMYFTTENAQKIDAIRNEIEQLYKNNYINYEEYYYLIASLIHTIPSISNISGTYGAFLKNWDKRAFKKNWYQLLEITESNIEHEVYNQNAFDLLKTISGDIIYIDPPYNSRQYASNYHILETASRWDYPEIKGKTGMRDWSKLKSSFCTKSKAKDDLIKLLNLANVKYAIMSYSSEGIMSKEDIIEAFEKSLGNNIDFIDLDYRRFKSNSRKKANKNVKEYIFFGEKKF